MNIGDYQDLSNSDSQKPEKVKDGRKKGPRFVLEVVDSLLVLRILTSSSLSGLTIIGRTILLPIGLYS